MVQSKPAIVFVHGAWHYPHHYTTLTTSLERAGYTVLVPCLPSSGSITETFAEDVSAVRAAFEDLIADEKEIVVVMHSYGGVVGSEASRGLSKQLGQARGGIIKHVYLCAIALDEGLSVYNWMGNKDFSWWEPIGDEQIKALDTHSKFYTDLDADFAEKMSETLAPMSRGAFQSKVTYAAWKYIDSAYIICENDNAVPLAAQLSKISQTGNKFSYVERLPAAHCPWLSIPEDTTAAVRRAIGEDI